MIPLVVDALAVARLTRLVTTDQITRRPREALQDRSRFLDELLACSWCSSVWLAFGVVAARKVAPKAWAPIATALAFSAVAGIVSETT